MYKKVQEHMFLQEEKKSIFVLHSILKITWKIEKNVLDKPILLSYYTSKSGRECPFIDRETLLENGRL